LLALSKGDPSCEAAVDFVTGRLRCVITVPPATLVALFDIIDKETTQEYREAAQNAERSISQWGFFCDELDDLQDVYAKAAVKLLGEKTDLPDALCQLVAEASVLKCAALLTDHSKLYKMRRENLEILLMERGLDSFALLQPAILMEAAERMFGS